MPKLRVHAFSISLDGYGAGPDQDRANPLGVGGDFLECLRAEDPLVQRHPTGAHRIGQILVGTGAMTIDGDSKCVYPKPRHARNSFPHRHRLRPLGQPFF